LAREVKLLIGGVTIHTRSDIAFFNSKWQPLLR